MRIGSHEVVTSSVVHKLVCFLSSGSEWIGLCIGESIVGKADLQSNDWN